MNKTGIILALQGLFGLDVTDCILWGLTCEKGKTYFTPRTGVKNECYNVLQIVCKF